MQMNHFYMSKYSEKIASEFEKRWKDAEKDQKFALNFWNEIAKELFDAESDLVKKRLKDEVKKVHQIVLEKHARAVTSEFKPSNNSEDQQE